MICPANTQMRSTVDKARSSKVERTKLTLGGTEVQHVTILPEHVDFLHARNRLHVEFLQRALELFVILGSRWLGLPHDLTTDCTLSTYSYPKPNMETRQSVHTRFHD